VAGGVPDPLVMIGVSLIVFPRLALGLSGFETGVSIVPLVRADAEDDPERPEGHIRNTRKMLTVAALIMGFYLLTTSIVMTLPIPDREFEEGESDSGRAPTSPTEWSLDQGTERLRVASWGS
jgi:hypothetical protein